MNDHPIQPPKLSIAYSETSEMAVLLAKMLTLVAPTSMTAEQQGLWLRAAIDALQDIRASEVQAVILQLQRSATRPNQIVPEIARLVSEKRKLSVYVAAKPNPFGEEHRISEQAQAKRTAAKGDKAKIAEAYEWEREERIKAGLHVMPRQSPLSREELDRMQPHVAKLGIELGYLKRENGMLSSS